MNWRDLAAGAAPAIPTPPSTGTPAPTPNWRDLGAQSTDAGGPPAPVTYQAPPPATFQAPAPAAGTNWGGQAVQAPAPVPPPQAPASPGPATVEQGQQAWQTAAGLGATPLTPQPTAPSSAPQGPVEDANAEVGMRIAAAGAAATDVDAGELLGMIRALQNQVQQLTQSQTQASAPDVVKYATAYADHLQAKADANPVINADSDHTFIPALQDAAKLVNTAEQVAATGAGHESLISLAKNAGAWVKSHSRKFPAIDYDYLLQLAEEVGSAAAKLLV